MKWIELLAFLSLFVTPALAQSGNPQSVAPATQPIVGPPSHFLSGNEILRYCAATSPIAQQTQCNGYIEGAADELEALRRVQGQPQCLPPDADASQVKDVFLAYLKRHPEDRQLSAAILETLAMGETWNCMAQGAH